MSLKEICKKRILEEMIGNGKKRIGYAVMITDEKTLRIVSACCKVYDIIQNGVTVVELLHKRRQRLETMDAIYFFSPSKKSVDILLDDFRDAKMPQYRHAHIFFSSPLDRELMEAIAESTSLVPRIKFFVEFNLNFISYEERVFHLDSPWILTKLFPLQQPELLYHIADQLVCLCLTLGEKPAVRYQRNKFDLSEQLASLLHQKLTSLQNNTGESSLRTDSTILILDRSIDLATLFVHEYTYQALAYDILNIPCCVAKSIDESSANLPPDDTFEHVVVNNLGEHETKKAFLGEDDSLWVRFRHEHIQDVNNAVENEVRQFAEENAAAKIHANRTLTTEETMKAIRALPQYQEMLAKYWTHVTMSEKCFNELKSRDIMRVGALEQDICCGVDKNGKEVSASKLLSSLGVILSDDQVGMEEKLRLLLLYLTQMDGVGEIDQRKLLEAAQLSLDNQRCIFRLLKMELHLANGDSVASVGKHEHRLSRDKERISYFKNRARNAHFELSRFEPKIKDILAKLADENLHGGFYPYVEEPRRVSKRTSQGQSALNGCSLGRGTQWDWSDPTDSKGMSSSSAFQSKPKNEREKKRLIVFVIGGITFGEMRSAYEIANQLDVQVYIGGTSILTPCQFLKILKEQNPY